MVQRVYSQIMRADSEAQVTVATGASQVSVLRSHLGSRINVSLEPCRRDTFPAIALVCAYLHDVRGVAADEAVAVCPVDPYVDDSYFTAVRELTELAASGTANLMLMGIEPTYPSAKYGYIVPESTERVAAVASFKEKPTEEAAAELIARGGLWNGGVFAFRLGYVLERAHELLDFTDYDDLFARYAEMEKISFDYAVVEHEDSIGVLRYAGEWRDLGTWNTLTEIMTEPAIGEVTMDDTCENSHAINELGVPLLCMGLKNIVVAAGPDGILVSDKERSAHIKPYVERIAGMSHFAEKSWGEVTVIDAEEDSLTLKVKMRAGRSMSYHSHALRDELWTVIRGSAEICLEGAMRVVTVGDSVRLPKNVRHSIRALTPLELIEVQLGTDITADDKTEYDM